MKKTFDRSPTLYDAAIELSEELDMAPELVADEGYLAGEEVDSREKQRKLGSLRNVIMFNMDETKPGYKQLMDLIDKAIGMMMHGISDIDEFYSIVDNIKSLLKRAIFG